MRARLLVLGAAVALALASASAALATFSSSAAGGPMGLSSATLAAPTSPSAAQVNCQKNKPVQISVSWTATSSGFATGYAIRRATTSGGPYSTVASVAISATSYTDASASLAYSTTYYYVVEATYQSWTADSSQSSVTTLSSSCK
jgi:hypothetical protein